MLIKYEIGKAPIDYSEYTYSIENIQYTNKPFKLIANRKDEQSYLMARINRTTIGSFSTLSEAQMLDCKLFIADSLGAIGYDCIGAGPIFPPCPEMSKIYSKFDEFTAADGFALTFKENEDK